MDTTLLSLYLKTATQSLHDRVEEKMNAKKIFTPFYTVEDYKQLIWQNYLFFSHFEEAVFNSFSPPLRTALQLPLRKKLPYLVADLEVLGLTASGTASYTDTCSEATAMGILYVMEGSTLGGNVIKKRLTSLPAFTDIYFNFFGCYQENTGPFWTQFKEVLDTRFTTDQYEEVYRGAVKAYDYMAAH
ncbi:biliverdin-producing heme oxygenase [Terrimonas rubra]|uniref:Biliverdin-producing heme oxygenase n=1 Tax=Terrimonas rubra TaxID=1035890 RepID=A0ABW6A681_9BACT